MVELLAAGGDVVAACRTASLVGWGCAGAAAVANSGSAVAAAAAVDRAMPRAELC